MNTARQHLHEVLNTSSNQEARPTHANFLNCRGNVEVLLSSMRGTTVLELGKNNKLLSITNVPGTR